LVIIKFYDITFREVMFNIEFKPSVTHTYQFNGSDLASGIYIYRIEYLDYSEVRKMMLLK
jgi:hypothetical protein